MYVTMLSNPESNEIACTGAHLTLEEARASIDSEDTSVHALVSMDLYDVLAEHPDMCIGEPVEAYAVLWAPNGDWNYDEPDPVYVIYRMA